MGRSPVSILASFLGISVSLSVVAGWAFGIPSLRTFFPGFPAMVPMTAMNILWLSLSLLFSYLVGSETRWSRVYEGLAAGFAAMASFMGLAALTNHAFGYQASFFRIFFVQQENHRHEILFAGLMSVQTSLISLLIGLSLVLRTAAWGRKHAAFLQILPLMGFGVSLMAVIGYVHDISQTGPSKFIGLSLVSAMSFIALSCGTLALDDSSGVMKRLKGQNSEGFFLRWFVAFSLSLPIVISGLITWGEDLELYPASFSTTLLVIFTITSLTILGFVLAHAIRRLEEQRLFRQRVEAREALRESEESLQEAKDRLEMALDASKMGLWEMNFQTGKTVCSPLTERMLGLAPGTFNETPNGFLNSIHPEDLDRYRASREEAIQSRKDFDIDFRVVWPDKSAHWVRCKARTKYSLSGKPLRISGTVLDVTAEKFYQEDLERALKAAESANRLKTSFLANMSHEIRTPLGAILGFTDLMADPDSTVEERAGYLKVISRNGKMLSQILNDILDLSKVESGHLNVEILPCPLREIVDEVVSLLRPAARDKKVDLQVAYAPSAPTQLHTDPIRLKQILMNLVGNAVKFTSEGWVRLGVHADGERVFFEIQDTGIGIEPENQGKLFRTFSQADDSMARKFGGSGLGLLLSRRLAHLLGGNVELVRSSPNHGSVFMASVARFPQKSGLEELGNSINAMHKPV